MVEALTIANLGMTVVSVHGDCSRLIICHPFGRCSGITLLSTNRHTCPCTRPPWPHRANILALHTLSFLPRIPEIKGQQLILVDFVIDQRVFWFRHDFARSVHVTRARPSVVFLLLSGPHYWGGGLSKGKVGAFVARAATKGSLHLLAEWHGVGWNDWSVVVVAARAGRIANEQMAGLLSKRRLVNSISQVKRSRKNCKVREEKRTWLHTQVAFQNANKIRRRCQSSSCVRLVSYPL